MSGWGTVGGGAWGASTQIGSPSVTAGYDSSDEDVTALPSGAAPKPPPAKAQPISAPPSAYPQAGMFSGGNINDAFEGPVPPSTSHMDLDSRERDLMEREAKLKKLEEEIRKEGGIRKNNWPVCFPIWHHDIEGEIPEESKRVVKEVYMSWWAFLFCLTFQFFCATVILGYQPDSNATPSWFLTIIYWIAGLAGSLWLWYKRLYHAARHGTTAGYFVFFLFYGIHICFCIWCAIAIPVAAASWSFSGYATALAAVGFKIFPGVIYFIGAACWTLESLWCLWCIKDAYLFFRGRGGIKQAKQDAALEIFKSQQAHNGQGGQGGAYNV